MGRVVRPGRPSEVCSDGGASCGDWIELHNTSPLPAQLAGWLLMDLQDNRSVLPEGAWIEPGGFLVVCEDPAAFAACYGAAPVPLGALGFGLNAENDGVSLYHGDQLCFSVVWDETTWPVLDDHVLSLIAPTLPGDDPASWQAVAMPGTPGSANPGWQPILMRPVIDGLRPNPVTGTFTLDYMVPCLPADLLVYDLAGRMIRPPSSITGYAGSVSVELPEGLPSGIYFAVLRSTGVTATAGFVVLRGAP